MHKERYMFSRQGNSEFNPDPVIPIYSARPYQVKKALSYVCSAAANKLEGKELELLIVILPNNNGSLYGTLKRICETDLGLISQCCLTKHVLKISKKYLSNVALKINVKMGGRNTVLSDALRWRIPLVSDIPTIIFGADVTHPESGEDCSPSIAAVVASQDWPEVTKYAGLVCAQPHRQELIQDLYRTSRDPHNGIVSGGMIRPLLLNWPCCLGYPGQQRVKMVELSRFGRPSPRRDCCKLMQARRRASPHIWVKPCDGGEFSIL